MKVSRFIFRNLNMILHCGEEEGGHGEIVNYIARGNGIIIIGKPCKICFHRENM